MAKKKKSSCRESPEDTVRRLKKERFARINAEARHEIIQNRILAAEEMVANVSLTQLPKLFDFNIYAFFRFSINLLNCPICLLELYIKKYLCNRI